MQKVFKFPFYKKWKFWVTISVIFIFILVGVATYCLVYLDTPFNRLKQYVLTDQELVNSAIIVEQTQETAGFDERDTLHLKLSPQQTTTMVQQNILQDCENSMINCTNPIWQPYINFHQFKQDKDSYTETISEFGVPNLFSEYNTQHVSCTSTWKPFEDVKQSAIGICADTESGDFWYEFTDY